jgi:hypothetical protein
MNDDSGGQGRNKSGAGVGIPFPNTEVSVLGGVPFPNTEVSVLGRIPFPNTEVSVLGRVSLPNTEVSVTRRHSPLVLLRVGRLEQASNTSKRLRRVSYFRYFDSRRHSVELLITTVRSRCRHPGLTATRQAGLPNRTSC